MHARGRPRPCAAQRRDHPSASRRRACGRPTRARRGRPRPARRPVPRRTPTCCTLSVRQPWRVCPRVRPRAWSPPPRPVRQRTGLPPGLPTGARLQQVACRCCQGRWRTLRRNGMRAGAGAAVTTRWRAGRLSCRAWFRTLRHTGFPPRLGRSTTRPAGRRRCLERRRALRRRGCLPRLVRGPTRRRGAAARDVRYARGCMPPAPGTSNHAPNGDTRAMPGSPHQDAAEWMPPAPEAVHRPGYAAVPYRVQALNPAPLDDQAGWPGR